MLKERTFAGEIWIEELDDLKEEFLELIDAAEEVNNDNNDVSKDLLLFKPLMFNPLTATVPLAGRRPASTPM